MASEKRIDEPGINASTAGGDSFFKVVQLNHLSVYWNPLTSPSPSASSSASSSASLRSSIDVCCCPFIGRPSLDIQQLMSRTIANRMHQLVDRPRHHYILFPLDISSHLDVIFDSNTGAAKVFLLFSYYFL
jgi:hypothetical protein